MCRGSLARAIERRCSEEMYLFTIQLCETIAIAFFTEQPGSEPTELPAVVPPCVSGGSATKAALA